ncbi:MAG: sugar nucleotide-binding protein [Nitrososphaera sp.]|nr:sugar nucleotide-binding protein [Nitrososphaera sp.]
MTTLITGYPGVLGKELAKVFPDSIHPSHKELDVGDEAEVFRLFESNKIDTIVHAAALTGIRPCEDNKDLAWKSNVKGTENLVNACLKYNHQTYFVFVSTACVFDGHRGMYNENDIPYPENFYALSKLLGEFAVRKLANTLIVRTNFVAKEPWRYPKAFEDRFGTYLYAGDVARGIKEVVNNRMTGIVHIVGDTKMSMFELAKKTSPNVSPMTIKEYSGPKLTMDMSLDTVRWKKYKISD